MRGRSGLNKKFQADYLANAGEYVNLAFQYEMDQDYESAFHSYKTCIEVLLGGVMLETDAIKREAIRASITDYITTASQLYFTRIAPNSDTSLWLESSLEINALRSLKANKNDLFTYKVLQVSRHNMVVIDNLGVKFLLKSVKKRLTQHYPYSFGNYPGGVPFMAELIKFFETESAFIFCLEHKPGGLLWKHLEKYKTSPEDIGMDSWNAAGNVDYVMEDLLRDRSRTFRKPSLVNEPDTFAREASEEIVEAIRHDQVESVYDSWFPETENDFEQTLTSAGFKSLPTSKSTPTTSMNHGMPFSLVGIPKTIGYSEAQLDEFLHRFLSDSSTRYRLLKVKVPGSLFRKWLARIVTALDFLHSHNVFWGDFNPANILLDQKGSIYLSHCFSWLDSSVKKWDSTIVPYIAPEILFSSTPVPTHSGDIWSLGAVLYSLVNGSLFVRDHPNYSTDDVSFPSYFSDSLGELILSMLNCSLEFRIP